MENPKWSGPMTHSPTTRSPTAHPLALEPISATSPAHSWPGTIGNSMGMMYFPASRSKSEWQIPTALDRIRTSSGPIAGTGTSSRANSLGRTMVVAFISLLRIGWGILAAVDARKNQAVCEIRFGD